MKTTFSLRKLFVIVGCVAAVAAGTFLVAGCKTAAVVGAVAGAGTVAVVIAKYKASAEQKALAEQRARSVVAQAVKPHLDQKRAKAQATAQKKIANIEKDYARRVSKKGDAATAAHLDAEKQQAVAKVQADTNAELAVLDREWQSLGGASTVAPKADAAPQVPAAPQYASLDDREMRDASAAAHLPKYLAVSVPLQGVAEERNGKGAVMLWDTRRNQLVNDSVYVLKRELQDGRTVKIAGYQAQVASN